MFASRVEPGAKPAGAELTRSCGPCERCPDKQLLRHVEKTEAKNASSSQVVVGSRLSLTPHDRLRRCVGPVPVPWKQGHVRQVCGGKAT